MFRSFLENVVKLVFLGFAFLMFLFACLSEMFIIIRKDQEVLEWIGSDEIVIFVNT